MVITADRQSRVCSRNHSKDLRNINPRRCSPCSRNFSHNLIRVLFRQLNQLR